MYFRMKFDLLLILRIGPETSSMQPAQLKDVHSRSGKSQLKIARVAGC